MTMNMKQWVADILASDKKKSLPVLSFPSIQKMGITVAELINSKRQTGRRYEDHC